MSNKKQTAAVYDRWLFTLGGGEQVAFAYATTLRDLGYQTSMLTHQKIDVKRAEAKMNVDLKGITLIYLPMMSSQGLSEYTEQYDVFINTSYLDYFPNRSKCGLLSIFFPSQIFLTPYEYIKRAIVLPSFSNFFIYPSIYEGFRFDEYKKRLIYKWLGKKSSIVFNKDIRACHIKLFFRMYALSVIDQIRFFIEDTEIFPTDRKMNDRQNTVTYSFLFESTKNKHFSIVLPDSDYAKEVALTRLTINDIRFVLYNIFKHFFTKWEMRLHGGPGVTKLSDLTSYQKIITISDFSKLWIKKYWGLSSDVLYPPVSTHQFYSSPKKNNWIVHVGRFFVTGHNKKQLDLVKVFRQLVDEKGLEGWELHFVGSIHDGVKHAEYFQQVQYLAKGYPVFFHLDAPFDELCKILSKSKIYWHATGLDENENTSPILFEHFGITTVEAMSSGCVPVVIKAGGQKEIVTQESGFTWTTRDELIERTWKLINDKELLKRLQAGALTRSKYFDKVEFKKRFGSLLEHSTT